MFVCVYFCQCSGGTFQYIVLIFNVESDVFSFSNAYRKPMNVTGNEICVNGI